MSNYATIVSQMLAQAATLLPFMKCAEVSQILRYASIYFLGFLVPTSTGHDFFTLRFESHRTANDLGRFIAMDLEERLESICRFIASHEFGEFNSFSDVDRETYFLSFLQNGLGPLLACRSAHEEETDLYHLLAMSIAPTTSASMIPRTAATLNKPSWIRTQRLMKSSYAHSFQIHYCHRVLIVNLLRECLVLPEAESASASSPLMDGAVSHLRASLYSFALGANCPQECYLAHDALVQIAVQTGLLVCVNEEWERLLERAIVNPRSCKCVVKEFCTHKSNGQLLEKFIAKFNGSRHYADENFTKKALYDLSNSIQQQVKLCQDKGNVALFHTCRLASLLRASQSLFFFLLAPSSDDIDIEKVASKKTENKIKANLIQASVQLIQHPDAAVSCGASNLMLLAFSYGQVTDTKKLLKTTLNSIKIALDISFSSEQLGHNVLSICIIASRKSERFALYLLVFLIGERKSSWKNEDKCIDDKLSNAIFSLIASISVVQPTAIITMADDILSLFHVENNELAKQHLAAAFLSTRRAYFFTDGNAEYDFLGTIKAYLSKIEPWSAYKVGCHALVTGNFAVARDLYFQLSDKVLSGNSFLWISALSTIAEAEASLLKSGANGIIEASTLLESSIAYLDSLSHTSRTDTNFTFQIEFLRLRIDFLDLIAVARQACQETRFIGGTPKLTTRTGLHLSNAIQCFFRLAGRFFSIYRRHGIVMCQQSRSCLRTLHVVCRYLGKAGTRFFPEVSKRVITPNINAAPELWPRGDQVQPVTQLLQKFDRIIFDHVDKSMDPGMCAKTMSHIFEGILKVPTPFPKCFLISKSIPKSHLHLSINMDRCNDIPKPFSFHVEDNINFEGDDQLESVLVYPGTPIPILASGHISPSLHKLANVPFSHVLIWTRFRFVAPLHTTDFRVQDDESLLGEDNTPEPSDVDIVEVLPPFSCQIPSSGILLLPIECQALETEGIYKLTIQLGCRDIRCGEWLLPLQSNRHQSLIVKVSRSHG